jgi:SAM-dependent methyltransferase
MTDAKKGEDLASAYEGLEDASSFPDAASVERYRHLLVARTAIQADFLIRRIPAPARLLEVACGNGRLLIEMARRRAIASGLGLDVARSRIAFAERWAADEGWDTLEFVAADALTCELPPQSFASVLVITGAFAYFEPLASGSATLLAAKLYQALARAGRPALPRAVPASELPARLGSVGWESEDLDGATRRRPLALLPQRPFSR